MVEMGVYSNVVNKGSVKEQLRNVGSFSAKQFYSNRFFYSLYKGFSNRKKKVTSREARPEAIITGLEVQCLTK